MDLDPSVEPELDHFSTLLPLPFRVATTVVLGESYTSLSYAVANSLTHG